MLQEYLPPEMQSRIGILSGPNIAKEIASQKPAATVISSTNPEMAKTVQKYFSPSLPKSPGHPASIRQSLMH